MTVGARMGTRDRNNRTQEKRETAYQGKGDVMALLVPSRRDRGLLPGGDRPFTFH